MSEEDADQRDAKFQEEIKRLNSVVQVWESRFKEASETVDRRQAEIKSLEEKLEVQYQLGLER